MANDPNNIDLNLKVQGAAQVAADLDSVTDAEKRLKNEAANPMALPPELLGPERTDAVEALTDAMDDLTEQEIKAAEEAGKATKAFTDQAVEQLKAEKAAEGQARQQEQLNKIIGMQRAQMAMQVAQGVGQMAEMARAYAADMQGLDQQSSKTWSNVAAGLDSVQGALSGAAQGFAAGGPMGAAIGGLTGMLTGPFKAAMADMQQSLVNAARAEKEAGDMTKRHQQLRENLATELRKKTVEDTYARELQSLTAQNRALERQADLKKVQLDTRQAQAEAAANAAIRGGANPERVNADLAQGTRNAEIERLNTELELAKKQMELAATTAAEVAGKAQAANYDGLHTQEEIDDLRKQATDAKNKANELSLDYNALMTATAEQVKQINAAAESKVAELGSAVNAKIGDTLNTAIAFLQGQAQLDSPAQEALKQLVKTMQDGVVSSNEIAAVNQAMAQLRASNVNINNEFLKGIGVLISDQAVIKQQLADLMGLRTRVETLETSR